MSEQTPFMIPIDEPLNDFIGHLEANPRTILSSRFGDGKSYFLQKLIENEEVKERFEFITIYPVNYQVLENKDVFDLIKVDLLFQLFCHGMISNSVVLKNDVALAFYIQKEGLSLAEALMPYFAEVALDSEQCKQVLLAFKGLKLFKDLRSKFLKFKEKYYGKDRITSFIDDVNSKFLYENDVVTELIQSSINDYKSRTGKRVALVIEDLDRIDPSHLFRILNVLSAHMDRCYRFSMEPSDLIGNKFDLDNIVIVVDYDNLKNIFHHFYGNETGFNGYISKFLTSVPFKYSLKDTVTEYYYNEISRITGAPIEMVKLINPKWLDVDANSIRDVVNAFNIDKQLSKRPIYHCYAGDIKLDTTILKILAFMRRLKLEDSTLIDYVTKLETNGIDYFCSYACPFVFLMRNVGELNRWVAVNDNGNVIVAEVRIDSQNGRCTTMKRYFDYSVKKSETPQIASFLLRFLRK